MADVFRLSYFLLEIVQLEDGIEKIDRDKQGDYAGFEFVFDALLFDFRIHLNFSAGRTFDDEFGKIIIDRDDFVRRFPGNRTGCFL